MYFTDVRNICAPRINEAYIIIQFDLGSRLAIFCWKKHFFIIIGLLSVSFIICIFEFLVTVVSCFGAIASNHSNY